MQKELKHFAFIDSQNLYFGMKRLGWNLDYRRFRIYLKEKYQAEKAYMFVGFLPANNGVYSFLQEAGYILIFKPILEIDGKIKGNCDSELVLQTMIEYPNYQKAIIISGDGDFYCLVKYLSEKNKLGKVLAVSNGDCSSLLKKVAGQHLSFISDLKNKLSYKKKNTP